MKAMARALIGRTITAVQFRPFASENGTAHDPVLILDNGRAVSFVVEETGGAEYGVTVCITERNKQRGKEV